MCLSFRSYSVAETTIPSLRFWVRAFEHFRPFLMIEEKPVTIPPDFPLICHILKVSLDGEKELVDEDTLEGCDIVLLVEHQHRFFIVDGIHGAE